MELDTAHMILGIERDASSEAIDSAYERLRTELDEHTARVQNRVLKDLYRREQAKLAIAHSLMVAANASVEMEPPEHGDPVELAFAGFGLAPDASPLDLATAYVAACGELDRERASAATNALRQLCEHARTEVDRNYLRCTTTHLSTAGATLSARTIADPEVAPAPALQPPREPRPPLPEPHPTPNETQRAPVRTEGDRPGSASDELVQDESRADPSEPPPARADETVRVSKESDAPAQDETLAALSEPRPALADQTVRVAGESARTVRVGTQQKSKSQTTPSNGGGAASGDLFELEPEVPTTESPSSARRGDERWWKRRGLFWAPTVFLLLSVVIYTALAPASDSPASETDTATPGTAAAGLLGGAPITPQPQESDTPHVSARPPTPIEPADGGGEQSTTPTARGDAWSAVVTIDAAADPKGDAAPAIDSTPEEDDAVVGTDTVDVEIVSEPVVPAQDREYAALSSQTMRLQVPPLIPRVHMPSAEVLGHSAVKLVSIPAGAFLHGCNERLDVECLEDERPARSTSLALFDIDRTEVRVEEYAKCTRAGRCSTPATTPGCNWPAAEKGEHPINCVDWSQANDYCAWVGKRLPAEAEWEKAARGDDRLYPWGNEPPSCTRAVMKVSGGEGCGMGSTWAVGSLPGGESPYGLLDMAGNVAEWTAQAHDRDPSTRVARGGSWRSFGGPVRTSYREPLDPKIQSNEVGFRCAKDVATHIASGA